MSNLYPLGYAGDDETESTNFPEGDRHVQSRPLQPVRQGHLDRLRRARRRRDGARARGAALLVPLARTTTPPPAPGRAVRPRTRSRVVAFIAAVTAFWLAAIPVSTSVSATSASATSASAASARRLVSSSRRSAAMMRFRFSSSWDARFLAASSARRSRSSSLFAALSNSASTCRRGGG